VLRHHKKFPSVAPDLQSEAPYGKLFADAYVPVKPAEN